MIMSFLSTATLIDILFPHTQSKFVTKTQELCGTFKKQATATQKCLNVALVETHLYVRVLDKHFH